MREEGVAQANYALTLPSHRLNDCFALRWAAE